MFPIQECGESTLKNVRRNVSLNKKEANMFECPIPETEKDYVQMAHGGGGRMMNQLIREVFLKEFGSPEVGKQNDATVLPQVDGRIAMTTDSFVVTPLEFPGGSIGSLAVHGTVNDLAMSGATPLYLTAGFILEEGLSLDLLKRVVKDMAKAAQKAGVTIVTGDTKVVERQGGNGLYINTSGVGIVQHELEICPASIREGDAVLLSGDLGRHGMTIMSLRSGLNFGDQLESDSAAVHKAALALIEAGIPIHCMRDVTRGGLTSTLSEIAEDSGKTISLNEENIPVRDDVRSACQLLGLDPLQVACEGRFAVILPAEYANKALQILHSHPVSQGAGIIGMVETRRTAPLLLTGVLGVERILTMPTGMQLPRIC